MEGFGFRIQDPEQAALIEKRTKAALALLVFDVEEELDRQTDKWGVQDHTLPIWLAILAEEYGEISKELLEGDLEGAVKECRHTTAVLGRIVEKIHRVQDAQS